MAVLQLKDADSELLDAVMGALGYEERLTASPTWISLEGHNMKSYNDRFKIAGMRSKHLTFSGNLLDKMSEILDRGALDLDENARFEEAVLRPSLLSGFSSYKRNRLELGRSLRAYKLLYKSRKTWTLMSADLGKLIGCCDRTLRRMIFDFEKSAGLAPQKAKRSHPRTKSNGEAEALRVERREQDAFMALCYHLDQDLLAFPIQQRLTTAAKALETLAYKYGFREVLSLTIEPSLSEGLISSDYSQVSGVEDCDDAGETFHDEREQPSFPIPAASMYAARGAVLLN